VTNARRGRWECRWVEWQFRALTPCKTSAPACLSWDQHSAHSLAPAPALNRYTTPVYTMYHLLFIHLWFILIVVSLFCCFFSVYFVLPCDCDQLLAGKRSHSPTSRFPSSPTPVVITEPFPDRTESLRHMSKEMRSDRQWNVCLRRHPDNVTYRWFLPADWTRRSSTTSTRCRQSWCWLTSYGTYKHTKHYITCDGGIKLSVVNSSPVHNG